MKITNIPQNSKELLELQDRLYAKATKAINEKQNFEVKGLMEVIICDANIIKAVDKIKRNQGSLTKGVDGKVINDYLSQPPTMVIEDIRKTIKNYQPQQVRRVEIPKSNGKKRKLGIPTIKDRIIQECTRNIIEPIAEAYFFKHSYGFRPMRNSKNAVARIATIVTRTNCYWAVEGDIKGYFDNINHNVMLKRLYNMGIRDKRVLMIIKQMLKAGVMNETQTTELGTPQGGIISPLLANIYLDSFDKFITREWEEKEMRFTYKRHDAKLNALRKSTNLIPRYYIRYADDWVILTDSKKHAETIKHKAKEYLKNTLKLELSEEKTKITNMRNSHIDFVGMKIGLRKGKMNNITKCNYVNHITPNEEKLKQKIIDIQKNMRKLKRVKTCNVIRLNEEIAKINSQIIGVSNYYDICDGASKMYRKYSQNLVYTSYKSLKKYGAKWTPANKTNNLIGRHEGYNSQIPSIQIEGKTIGITKLDFTKWNPKQTKRPDEIPYSKEGRAKYLQRTGNKPLYMRIDEVTSNDYARVTRMRKSKKYNLEYFIARPNVYRRDKGKCKICGENIIPNELHVHHIKNNLPESEINKIKNLACMHDCCHRLIKLNEKDIQKLPPKIRTKVEKYKKLNISN